MPVPPSPATSAATRLQAMAHRRLRVGEHLLDIGSLRLLDVPESQRLTPKAAAVLIELACRAGQTVGRNELLDAVWAGTCPTPDVLTQAITDLRRALGDESQAPRYIETVPKLGYRLVAEVAFLDAVEASAHDGQAGAATVTPRPPRRLRPTIVVAVILGVVAAMAVAWFATQASRAPAVVAVPEWVVRGMRTLTTDPGAEKYPRISPDGTRIAYSASDSSQRNFRLLVRTLEQARPLRLGVNEDGEEFRPAWSPDGASIAFLRQSAARCDIIMTPAMGGIERRLRACPDDPVNMFSWAPAGDRLVASRYDDDNAGGLSIGLLALDGSDARALEYSHAPVDKDIDARYSPDGRWIAFRRGTRRHADLWLVGADGGDARALTRLAGRLRGHAWTRDSSALVFSSGHEGRQALYAVERDGGRVQPLGMQPAENPSAATGSDGFVYEIARARTQLREVRLRDGETEETAILATTANDAAPAISPVDARLVFVSDRSGSQQLWLHDPASASLFPLTDYDQATLAEPVWRADGQRILFSVRGAGDASGLVEIDPLTRAQRRLTEVGEDVRQGGYGASPDEVLAVVADSAGRTALVALPASTTTAAGRRVLAEGVGRAETDPATGAVYFTRLAERGLFRLDRASGAMALVTVATPRFDVDGWHVASGNIVYAATGLGRGAELRNLDPRSGADWLLVGLPEPPAELEFSVSADGDRIVLVHVAADDTDIGAFRLERERTAAAGSTSPSNQ